jgi:hypothetical protein
MGDQAFARLPAGYPPIPLPVRPRPDRPDRLRSWQPWAGTSGHSPAQSHLAHGGRIGLCTGYAQIARDLYTNNA